MVAGINYCHGLKQLLFYTAIFILLAVLLTIGIKVTQAGTSIDTKGAQFTKQNIFANGLVKESKASLMLYAPADGWAVAIPSSGDGNKIRFILTDRSVIEYQGVKSYLPDLLQGKLIPVKAGAYVGELNKTSDINGYKKIIKSSSAEEENKRQKLGVRMTADILREKTNKSASAQSTTGSARSSQIILNPFKSQQLQTESSNGAYLEGSKVNQGQDGADGFDQQSTFEVVAQEVRRRVADENWAFELTKAHPRSVTLELAKIRATQLWLNQKIAERKERIEALYAILLALRVKNSS